MLRGKRTFILVSGKVAFSAEVIEHSEPVGIAPEAAGKLHDIVARWCMGCVYNYDVGHLLANLFNKFPWERRGDTESCGSTGAHTVISERETLLEIRFNRFDNPLSSVTVIAHHHDMPAGAPSESSQKLEKFHGFVGSSTDFCEVLFAQMGFICGNRRQLFKLVEQLVQFFVRFWRWVSILELIGQRFQNACVFVSEASEFQIPLQDVVYIELPVPCILSVPVKFSHRRVSKSEPFDKKSNSGGVNIVPS